MFGRRGGPLLGMATLLLIAYAGFATSPPMTAPHPNSANKQKGVNHKGEDNESPLGTAWTWLGENHDRIDPLTAIAALVVAVAVAYVTGRLWQATRDLAKSTEDLAKGARDQSAEMKLARELTEKNFMLAEKQLLLAAQQSEFAQKQHGLEREQYLAVHRPRIAIRSIHIERQPNQAI